MPRTALVEDSTQVGLDSAAAASTAAAAERCAVGGRIGGRVGVASANHLKLYLTFTVPPKNSKPSSTLKATSQWSTTVPEPTPPKVMPCRCR